MANRTLALHLPGGRQLFVTTGGALWTQQRSSGVCYKRRKSHHYTLWKPKHQFCWIAALGKSQSHTTKTRNMYLRCRFRSVISNNASPIPPKWRWSPCDLELDLSVQKWEVTMRHGNNSPSGSFHELLFCDGERHDSVIS